MSSICGVDCNQCDFKSSCAGCVKTNGHPFKGECIIASCAQSKSFKCCSECDNKCELKRELIKEFNDLGIKDLHVEELNALVGSFINMEYTLENGSKIKLLDDTKIYFGYQIKKSSKECYGIVADKDYLLVCEYGVDGTNPKIIMYKKRM